MGPSKEKAIVQYELRQFTLLNLSKNMGEIRVIHVQIHERIKDRNVNTHLHKEAMTSAKRTSYTVRNVNLVLNDERELLNIRYPRSMTMRDLILNTKVFKRVVIHVEDELLLEEIVAPVFDCLHNCVELNIIRTEIKLGTREILTEIGNRTSTLAENRTYTCLGCITVKLER